MGTHPRQMMWIYKTIIIPKITYCSVVWAINMNNSQYSKISTLQTLAQHMITRCKTSTPKVLLDLLLNMEDLPLKIECNALKRALALKAENHWNFQKNKSENYQTSQENIDWRINNIPKIDPNIKTDKISPTSILDKKYKTCSEKRENIQTKDCTTNLLIFTDGSKDDNGHTGYGIYFSGQVGNLPTRVPGTLTEPSRNPHGRFPEPRQRVPGTLTEGSRNPNEGSRNPHGTLTEPSRNPHGTLTEPTRNPC